MGVNASRPVDDRCSSQAAPAIRSNHDHPSLEPLQLGSVWMNQRYITTSAIYSWCIISIARACVRLFFKMGMGRPGPVFGPGPMALRPILGVMGRPIFPRCYGLDGPLGIMGRPKYFFIILNHEYYQHF